MHTSFDMQTEHYIHRVKNYDVHMMIMQLIGC
jgi:hypothetical protein